LRVAATAVDPESHVRKVVFYVGKPLRKGDRELIPADAVVLPARRLRAEGDVWTAVLPVETVKPARFDLTVQATNGAGESSSETITIRLVDAPKVVEKVVLARITGTVLVGDRPQANVPVSLADLKGMVKAATKTDKAGAYVFADVLPGSYVVTAAKADLKLRGETAVQVPAGVTKVADVDVSLSR
jgi:hypothetical protein